MKNDRIFKALILLFSFVAFSVFSLFFSNKHRFEDGIYLDYAKSYVTDREFSVINQRKNFGLDPVITKTYNFHEWHGEGPSIGYAPFFAIFKSIDPDLKRDNVDLLVILINALFFCMALMKVQKLFYQIFSEYEFSPNRKLAVTALFLLSWSGLIFTLIFPASPVNIVAFLILCSIEIVWNAHIHNRLSLLDCFIFGMAFVVKSEGFFLAPLMLLIILNKNLTLRIRGAFVGISLLYLAAHLNNNYLKYASLQIISNPISQFEFPMVGYNLFYKEGWLYNNPFYLTLFFVPAWIFIKRKSLRLGSKRVQFISVLMFSFLALLAVTSQIMLPITPFSLERNLATFLIVPFGIFHLLAASKQWYVKLALTGVIVWGVFLKFALWYRYTGEYLDHGKGFSLQEVFDYFTSGAVPQIVSSRWESLVNLQIGLVSLLIMMGLFFWLILVKNNTKLLRYFTFGICFSFLWMSLDNERFNWKNSKEFFQSNAKLQRARICEGRNCFRDIEYNLPVIEAQCKVIQDQDPCIWYRKYYEEWVKSR